LALAAAPRRVTTAAATASFSAISAIPLLPNRFLYALPQRLPQARTVSNNY
jgi:hypothetical protein